MIFTQNYFGKNNIEEIAYNDIVHFFSSEKEESDKVEFKSFELNQKEGIKGNERGILKVISAFLNSEGGLLIWGAPKGKKVEGKKEQVFCGELSMVDRLYEKDQFINKISDSITPLPRGVNFHCIEHKGKYVYIFEVLRSEYSPHQYANQYYMRLDGQSKPAPHHYIEALFKRVKYPNLKGFIGIDNWDWKGDSCKLNISVWLWNFSQFQNATDISYKLICDVGKFSGDGTFKDKNASFGLGGKMIKRSNLVSTLHFGDNILQREEIFFTSNELRIKEDIINVTLIFGGKETPSLKSEYKINLSLPESPHNRFDHHIVEINENVLLTDLDLKAESERVGELLGRKIH